MFSAKQRMEITEEMSKTTYDVLVIGGGITGCGIALDATTRGMKTALIEMQDFAAGTSSRSTKLVHGGLRYLKQFEVKWSQKSGKSELLCMKTVRMSRHQNGCYCRFIAVARSENGVRLSGYGCMIIWHASKSGTADDVIRT